MEFIPLIISAALGIVAAIGGWKAFEKAGQPGWAILIPIYNIIVLLQIAGKPVWWIFLMLIPCVNIYFLFVMYIDFAKCYGKEAGFAIGLMFLGFIFWPILGFGDARYRPQISARDDY